jgi:Ni/Co efflux regulator RcnB
MKFKTLVCALTAATLGLGSISSFAQDRRGDHRGDRAENRGDYRGDNRGGDNRGGDNIWERQRAASDDLNRRYGERDGNDVDRRGMSNRMGNRGGYRAEQYYYGARGPEWRRGGHIPPQYRSRQYVVNDWRGHHLNAPPRGYQWVQVGSDYVLVAIATGIIAQLLLNQ